MIRKQIFGFGGGRPQRWSELPFPSAHQGCKLTNMTCCSQCWFGLLASAVLIGSPLQRYSSPIPAALIGRKSLFTAHTQGVSHYAWSLLLHKLFGNLLCRRFVSSIYYSIIYINIDYWIFFFTLGYKPVLIFVSNCSFFSWLLSPFHTPTSLWSFLNAILTFWHYQLLHLNISCFLILFWG